MDSAPVTPSAGTPSAASSSPSSKPSVSVKPSGSPPAAKGTSTTQPAASGATSVNAANASHPPAPQAETPAQKQARLIKYKVHGKESELDVNSLSDEELATRIQLGEAGRTNMQKAAEVLKAWEQHKARLNKDPIEALQELGVDVMKVAEQRLVEQFRQEQLPETDRERLRLERELADRDAKLKAYEESQARAQQEALESQLLEQAQSEFAEALDSETIPRNRQTMSMMAQVAMDALDHGLELTPRQLAAEVNNRLRETTKHVFGSLKGEQLASFLGPEVVKEVLRHQVELVKAKPPSFVEPQAAVQEAKRAESKVNRDDFKRANRAVGIKEYMKNLKRGG